MKMTIRRRGCRPYRRAEESRIFGQAARVRVKPPPAKTRPAVLTPQVNHTFLEDNAQTHTSAMSAFGDVFDNARESKARSLRISSASRPSRRGKSARRGLRAVHVSARPRSLTVPCHESQVPSVRASPLGRRPRHE